jgi:hypothetical protein
MRLETDHNGNYRYPGAKFFEPDQKDVFFGRKQETADLVHSIKAYDVFVIFADSGIGKTSLLNAGLIPQLVKENMVPVKFRFQDINISPLQTIVNKLSEYIDPAILPSLSQSQKLWRLFRSCVFSKSIQNSYLNAKNEVTPLFIFDQFEEFFNHSKQNREECIDEISDLVNDYVPDFIKQEMKEKFQEKDPTPAEVLYYTPARVKMLFLIRADKLKLLDDLSKKIPLILRNRFHLKPLNAKQAEQAILLPASLPKNGFISPSFSYQEEAVTEICANLKNAEEEVESFQLQILCRELEKRIVERAEKGDSSLWITAEELGGKAGIENITKNYYNNQINSIPKEEDRKKAALLIEDKLIIEERRISLPESFLLNEGYSKELLDYLVNVSRIIRVDNNRNVEISHDRLISPILQSKQQREREEEKLREAQQIQRFEEEREQKDIELKKEKKAKQRLLFLSIGTTIMFLTSAFFFMRMLKLDSEAKIGTINYFIGRQEFIKANSVLNSTSLFNTLNFYNTDTIKILKESVAKELRIQSDYINSVKKGDSVTNVAITYLNRADTLMFIVDSLAGNAHLNNFSFITQPKNELVEVIGGEKLLPAIGYYLQARAMKFYPLYDSLKAELRLSNVISPFQTAFEQCINSVFIFRKLNDKQKARTAFAKAQRIKQFADSTGLFELKQAAVNDFDSLQKTLQR